MKVSLVPTELIDGLRAWFHPKDRSVVLANSCFIEGQEIATPGTPVAGRRRLYAKSGCWYDLGSNGTETGLCVSGVDPAGHTHSKLSASDGSPTDVMAADAAGDVTHPYNLILSGVSKAIKGTGSNYPDLGSTTDAQKIGNIYQYLGKDSYPAGDKQGLASRFIWNFSITDHFRDGVITPGYAWLNAGTLNGITAQTPSSINYSSANEYLFTIGNAARASFLYKSASVALDTKYIVAKINPAYLGYSGVRVDKNDDNNFAEFYIKTSGVSIVFESKGSVGGVVTTTTGVINFPASITYVIRLYFYVSGGTLYCNCGLFPQPGITLEALFSNLNLGASWGTTTTRWGLLEKNGGYFVSDVFYTNIG